MRELQHNDTIRPWRHNNMARPQDYRAPRRSKFVAGGFIALLAALFVMALFQAPQITWMVGLAAALTMLAVATALGFRQWARGRTK
jgi:predicted lipid-binding transport protein (Tim44 family)